MPGPRQQTASARNDHQNQRPPAPAVAQAGEEEGRKLLKTRMVKVFVAMKTSEMKEGKQSIESIEVRNKTIEDAIDIFTESVKIASDAIDSLSKIHPFIAAPLKAFQLVIKLDLKRRENHVKVVAIKLQMMSLICTLYRLRDVKEVDEVGEDGLTIQGRLKDLLEEITSDIEKCASDCDLYLKKSLLRRLLKAPIYESRLAKYAAKFTDHETAIERALQMHSVFTIDATFKLAGATQAQVIDMQEDIKKILRCLDTKNEKQVRLTIEEAGGAAASLGNKKVQKELISRAREPLPTTGAFVPPDKIPPDEFNFLVTSLRADLSQDTDKDMEQNFILFKGKLEIQAEEIKKTVRTESDRVISELSGNLQRINDPQLREIWKEMGWKGSAKSRNFVFALRDYFEYRNKAETHTTDTSKGGSGVVRIEGQEVELQQVDEWAKACISISHLQPILEEIDDDGSGFINIKELNEFTNDPGRPGNWSLLHWLAYWAVGWHDNIVNYKTEIYQILRCIVLFSEDCRPDNRNLVNRYLQSWAISRVERLLQCTRSHTYPHVNPQLFKFFASYEREGRGKLQKNLERISYNIDSEATISLVCGQGRIEKYIYPLLALILQRHMDIINLAGSYIINSRELDNCQQSLICIFSVFDRRFTHLEAVFKQMKVDSENYFRSFAFGMFQASSINKIAPIDSTLEEITTSSGLPEPISPNELGEDEGEQRPALSQPVVEVPVPPITILKYAVIQPFTIESQDVINSQAVTWPDHKKGEHPMNGIWNGCLMMPRGQTDESHRDHPIDGLFTLKFDLSDEQKSVSGKGWSLASSECQIDGLFQKKSETNYSIDIIINYIQTAKPVWMRCKGTFYTHMNHISGVWYTCRSDEPPPTPTPGAKAEDTPTGKFLFTRTPADVYRFRPPSNNQMGTREWHAKDLWNFALSAVRYRVQRKLLTKDFVASTLREGRRLKELQIKHLITRGYGSDITKEEDAERMSLIATLGLPAHGFYNKIARFLLERMPQYSEWNICAGCKRQIIQCAFQCIHCYNSSLESTLFLCRDCKERVIGFHDESHVMLETEYGIPYYSLKRVVATAREVSDLEKMFFQKIESRPLRLVGGMDENDGEYDQNESDNGEESRNPDDEDENQSAKETRSDDGEEDNQSAEESRNDNGSENEGEQEDSSSQQGCEVDNDDEQNQGASAGRGMSQNQSSYDEEDNQRSDFNSQEENGLGQNNQTQYQERRDEEEDEGNDAEQEGLSGGGGSRHTGTRNSSEWGQHEREEYDHDENEQGTITRDNRQTIRQPPQTGESYDSSTGQYGEEFDDGDDQGEEGPAPGRPEMNQIAQPSQMRQSVSKAVQGRGLSGNTTSRGQPNATQPQIPVVQGRDTASWSPGENVDVPPTAVARQPSQRSIGGGAEDEKENEYESGGYPDEADGEYDFAQARNDSEWEEYFYLSAVLQPPNCNECTKEIVLPCWIGFPVPVDQSLAYYCNDCGLAMLPPPPHKMTPPKKYKPALIWIRNSNEVEASLAMDPITRVEQGIVQVGGDLGGQLEELRGKIANHAELAARLYTAEDRFDAIESRLGAMEGRLGTMEGMLKDLLSALR